MTLDTRKHVSQMSDKEITGILQFVKLNYNKFELSNHAIEKCNKLCMDFMFCYISIL